MTTTTKTNAREQLLNFVLSQGWELDPARTVWSGNFPAERNRVQDPHAFRKPAANGGTWSLELDYNVKSEFHKTDNRLRRAVIRLFDAEGKVTPIGAKSHNHWVELDSTSGDTYSSSLSYQLWVVTYGVTGIATLRQHVEAFVVNPDLAAWLAEEARVNYELRVAEQRRQREEEAKARKRPLDITVEPTEWKSLASKLDDAARTVRLADGLTNLPQAVADLETAVAALKAALPQAVLH